jgi:hypothetical protein
MRTVFTLTSGRSGTHYLNEFLRANTRECVSMHEPYFDSPTLFGRWIYARHIGDTAGIRHQLEIKSKRIARYAPKVYVETSHAFLKTYWDLAPEYFPDLSVIHVVRDPLKVARSEAQRFEAYNRWYLPMCFYTGCDGKRYPRWSLTGLERIFRHFQPYELTLFQKLLVQWIEIENRAMKFLDQFDMHKKCFFLHSTPDLNDPTKLRKLIEFIGVPQRFDQLRFPQTKKARNVNPGEFRLSPEQEQTQAEAVVQRLPAKYFEIFRRKPYAALPWSKWLVQSAISESA